MRIGLDRLPTLPVVERLRSQRVGLLAHPASVDGRLRHISAVLEELGIRPVVIFGPEHGYGGEAQDMIGVPDARDETTGAPIVSLYGESFDDLVPPERWLREIDVLLVDLADVGSRYYTYVWTALLAVRAAANASVHTLLLDRPNPIGGGATQTEGALQRPGFLSFVGLEPVPIRHGLTLGEIVAHFAARDGLPLGEGGALSVVSVEGWDRELLAHAWDRPFVAPSPNMPTADTALVYPGGCLVEGTNLSEGRGTTRPFELVGAPFLDGKRLAHDLAATGLPGFVARPLTFLPTFQKHARKICGGVQIHVTDARSFRPVATYVALIALAHAQAKGEFRFRTERYEFVDHIPAIDLLTGSSDARLAIERGEPARDIAESVSRVDSEWEGEREAALRAGRRASLVER